jgi:hypothetical protein
MGWLQAGASAKAQGTAGHGGSTQQEPVQRGEMHEQILDCRDPVGFSLSGLIAGWCLGRSCKHIKTWRHCASPVRWVFEHAALAGHYGLQAQQHMEAAHSSKSQSSEVRQGPGACRLLTGCIRTSPWLTNSATTTASAALANSLQGSLTLLLLLLLLLSLH